MKRIVVCLDGTWNTADRESKITNVVRLMRALRPRDDAGIEQVVFYDKGVGTGGPIDRIRGGAFGRGLMDNLKDGYCFIANNYAPGDEIYIFGFSRGAFTARSLAGLIGWLGLLHKTISSIFRPAWPAIGAKTPPRAIGCASATAGRTRCAFAAWAFGTRWARSAFR